MARRKLTHGEKQAYAELARASAKLRVAQIAAQCEGLGLDDLADLKKNIETIIAGLTEAK